MNFLKELRKNIGLSQAKLAELVGVSLMTIRHIEGGRLALSSKLAMKISAETGCGWWLILDTGECKHGAESLDLEGISFPLRDEFAVGRLTLTAGKTSTPLTQSYYEDYRKKIEISEKARPKLSILETLIKTIWDEAVSKNCHDVFFERTVENIRATATSLNLKNPEIEHESLHQFLNLVKGMDISELLATLQETFDERKNN